MKESLLIIVLLLSTFTTYGQEKTNNSYFTWENFMDSEKEDNSKLFEKIVESIEIEE